VIPEITEDEIQRLAYAFGRDRADFEDLETLEETNAKRRLEGHLKFRGRADLLDILWPTLHVEVKNRGKNGKPVSDLELQALLDNYLEQCETAESYQLRLGL